MTTPRDAISGLSERLRKRSEPSEYSTGDVLGEEAATQLDSLLKERDALQARVKELEDHNRRLGQGGAERYWENRYRDEAARALRAEQERDEAYERAADAMWKAVDPSMEGILREAAERADVAIRRLSAGPEKITAASYVEERK